MIRTPCGWPFVDGGVRWSAVRTLVGGNQFAEHRNGSHQDEAAEPNDCDRLVRMAQRLPSPGPQRMTDSVVPLHRDGHQRPRGHSHRSRWNKRNNETSVEN